MDCSQNIDFSRLNCILGKWLHYGRLVMDPFRGEDGQDMGRTN